MPKRDPSALAKRSRAQHNQETVLPPVEPAPTQAPPKKATTTERQPTADAAPRETAAPQPPAEKKRRAAPPEGMRFVGLGVPREWWDDARAAFATDFWDDEDAAPETFRAWVAQAVAQRVELTTEQRTEQAAALAMPEGRKITREIALPVELVEQVEAARREDSRATRSAVSRSAWITTAMRVASEATRARHGGHLDPAPAKLPTRGLSA